MSHERDWVVLNHVEEMRDVLEGPLDADVVDQTLEGGQANVDKLTWKQMIEKVI